jgi:hypothetical protein
MPIDDDTLTRLVTAALDEVAVPADGPERILAARGSVSEATPVPDGDGPEPDEGEVLALHRPRRHLAIAGGIAAVLVTAIAVVSAGVGVGGQGASGPSGVKASPSAGAERLPVRAPVTNGPLVAAPGGTPTNGPTSDAPAAPSGTKVVQTGSLTLTVPRGKVPTTVGALGDAAAGLGGSVSRSQTSPDGSGTTADVTLQVPSAAWAQLLKAVEALGAPSAVTTSASDVTGTYVDLTSRINALEATRQQFLDILGKAQTIGDILAVEAQITPLQTQIEQLQGQQQVLDQQTSTASLSVHVVERAPAAATAPSGLTRAWQRATSTFTSGMESVVAALGGVAVFLVCTGVLAVACRLTWVVLRRRLV